MNNIKQHLENTQSIGVDIVKVERIQNLYDKHSSRFIERILTVSEREFLPIDRSELVYYLAKRWSAKEAFSKALGTGIGKHFSFQDLSIISRDRRKPEIILNPKVISKMSLKSYDISWSDEKEYVVSFCLVTRFTERKKNDGS